MRAGKIRRRLCRSVFGRADQKCCGERKSAAVVSLRHKLGRDFWENEPNESLDALVVHRSQEPGVLILEYEVHREKLRAGKAYDNRLISVRAIKELKNIA